MTMRRNLLFALGMALMLSTGCSRYLKTKEVRFWRDPAVGGVQEVFVDIVYPQTVEQREEIVEKFKAEPLTWFRSRMRNQVAFQKVDVKRNGQSAAVKKKVLKDIGILIFAEFGERPTEGPNAVVGKTQKPVVQIHQLSVPKPGKREYIWIGPGYMERRKSRPTDLDE